MKSLRATSSLASQLSSVRAARAATPSFVSQSGISTPYQKRTFFPNPFAPGVQTLTASRTLPYKSDLLYDIISDVSSYHAFLPFCRGSEVTKWSKPDKNGKRWPEEGKLVIGFNDDIGETFYSRVYCVPGEVVEAVSGATETTLSPQSISHHNPRPSKAEDPSRNATVLTQLLTRWTLKPFPYKPGPTPGQGTPQETTSPHPARDQTEVNLAIDYAFGNPMYAALSAAAAPKVAEKMIQAFETRVKTLMDRPSMGGTDSSNSALEGLLRGGRKEEP